ELLESSSLWLICFLAGGSVSSFGETSFRSLLAELATASVHRRRIGASHFALIKCSSVSARETLSLDVYRDALFELAALRQLPRLKLKSENPTLRNRREQTSACSGF